MTNETPHPVIVSYEILTSLGNLEETWQGLMSGQSGLLPVTLPDVPNTYPAGQISALGEEYGSTERLKNLLITGLNATPNLPALGKVSDIIVATTKGAVDELLGHPDNPTGQPGDIGQMVADQLSSPGKHLTVSAACASGTVALIQAAKQIMAGSSECVIIVGIDLLSSFVMAGFDALKGLSPNPCLPFDGKRDGLSLGEGIGIVVMCSDQFAAQQTLPALASIAGWGVSCDATHITAPSRDGRGLIQVIKQATRNGAIKVGAINAHGTGTVYNDAMELTAFNACWDEQPPFHSVKGGIGHCLGAAGVIEAAIGVRSLAAGKIPPSIGYRKGDAPAGTISGTSSLPLTASTVMACNSGFGGINAGIIFSQS